MQLGSLIASHNTSSTGACCINNGCSDVHQENCTGHFYPVPSRCMDMTRENNADCFPPSQGSSSSVNCPCYLDYSCSGAGNYCVITNTAASPPYGHCHICGSSSSSSSSSSAASVCGNGVVESGEQCDPPDGTPAYYDMLQHPLERKWCKQGQCKFNACADGVDNDSDGKTDLADPSSRQGRRVSSPIARTDLKATIS